MLPIGRLPESLSNHRHFQLNRRRLWLANLSAQRIRFCRIYEHSLTHQLFVKSPGAPGATTLQQ